jgi:hypothetical protein
MELSSAFSVLLTFLLQPPRFCAGHCSESGIRSSESGVLVAALLRLCGEVYKIPSHVLSRKRERADRGAVGEGSQSCHPVGRPPPLTAFSDSSWV